MHFIFLSLYVYPHWITGILVFNSQQLWTSSKFQYKTLSTALYPSYANTCTCPEENPRVFNSVPIKIFAATGGATGSGFLATGGDPVTFTATTTGSIYGGSFLSNVIINYPYDAMFCKVIKWNQS